jgi:hypothetical protein
MAAMRSIARLAHERKSKRIEYEENNLKDIWAGLGLGLNSEQNTNKRKS